MLSPVSSASTLSGNVPFREDMAKSVIRTTVAVANSCPLIPPPLERVDNKESPPSFPEAHLRTRIPVLNGSKYVGSQQEVPNLFQQEPSLQNPP